MDDTLGELPIESRIDITRNSVNEVDDDSQRIFEYYAPTPSPGFDQQDFSEDRREDPNGIEQWLPITESRKGNSWTSAFLLLCSGIGTQQAVSLPVAFLFLGWFWGIFCLSAAFVWQLYTTGLLVRLHEPAPGTRYSRYLHLSITAFGEKMGKLLVIFPLLYLAGGTCTMLVITGGGTMKLFYQLMCGDCSQQQPLTSTEWFLVFACLAILVALCCPNLNSVARISLLGAITAVAYCMILWTVVVAKGRDDGTVYDPAEATTSTMSRIRGVLRALGIIALVFRGHNVVLEIQGTMPSGPKSSSSKPMWRGVAASYLAIAMCFFPLAIAGYWAYGNKIPVTGGILTAVSTSLHQKASKQVLGLVYVLIVISCVSAYQIYAMVFFDNLERLYSSKSKKRCPKLVRHVIRIFYGGVTFFLAVTFPFLPKLALLIGGIALPVTFGYPCFMWIAIKKPPMKSPSWWFNFVLGCLGIGMSVVLIAAAVWDLVCRGLNANFFHPN